MLAVPPWRRVALAHSPRGVRTRSLDPRMMGKVVLRAAAGPRRWLEPYSWIDVNGAVGAGHAVRAREHPQMASMQRAGL